MRRVASCETFRRAGKSTQPALPTLPEKGVSDIQVQRLLETINEILEELGQPTRSLPYKNTFLETFMQKVDDRTTQLLNERFIR
jgi:broad specificity phosphatase PhoE